MARGGYTDDPGEDVMAQEFVWLAAGLVTFAAGLAAGAFLSRADRATKRRVGELEAEFEQMGTRLEAERESVAKHFDRTGELFRDLTRDYTALYAHLAEGARDLCPERIGSGFSELPGLVAGPGLTPEGRGIASAGSQMESSDVSSDGETENERSQSAAGVGGT
jgi:uncharacterized membrane-anchored protein YhcB (DUF1043 family)